MSGGGFDCRVVREADDGRLVELDISGRGAKAAFENEAGGHRFQRVSPTEKRGRVHTSTVTVAVLDCDSSAPTVQLHETDLVEERYKGGKGGQHQNKHANNVRLTHTPTGLRVQVEGRQYHKNRAAARKQLLVKLEARDAATSAAAVAASVAGQVGSGMRGDKRRTVAMQRDQVVDHVSGWSTTCKRYLRGIF